MKPTPNPRGEQTPAELVEELMGVVRRQFYPDSLVEDKRAQKRWFQDSHLIKSWVVLWPAVWLEERGVWVTPERYKAAVLGILDEVKRHGDTGAVKNWPRYLASCVQSRFQIRAEEFLEEGKAAREVVERVALGLAKPAKADAARRGADVVKALADAKAVLGRGAKRPKKPAAAPTLPGF